MRNVSIISVSAMMIAVSGTACGQIKVEHWDEISPGGYINVTTNTSYVDTAFATGSQLSGSNLELKSNAGRYRVTTNDPDNEDIGIITYNGTATVKILLMTNDNPSPSQGQPAARDWAGLSGTGVDDVRLQVRLSNKLTGDVTAGEILRIDADFGINSGIEIIQTQSYPARAIRSSKGGIDGDITLEQGSIEEIDALHDITGTIIIENGDIDLLQVRGSNDFLGDLIVEDGKIDTVFVQGNIGSPTDTAHIYSLADVSGLSSPADITIGRVLCRGKMYANIVASEFPASEGKFELIRANQGVVATGLIGMNLTDTPMDFQGYISTYDAARYDFNFNPAANIPCVMFKDVLDSSTIEFYDEPLTPITINSLAPSAKILIGNRLSVVSNPNEPTTGIFEDSMIYIEDEKGLKGQIIINQGDGTGTWAGEFGIDNSFGIPMIEIKPSGGDDDAPFYETLSSTLGGGAIGLAPFNFHAKESVPAADGGAMLDPAEYDSYEVTIEHYGRVYEGDTTDSDPAITIKYGTDISIWVDVTGDFDIAVGGTEPAADRDIKITPASGKEWMNGFYTIVPNDLKCADVSGNPQAEYVFDSAFSPSAEFDDRYVFTISADTGCDAIGADVNGDGNITPADFTAWIVAFNNDDPECDQNNDGNCTAADFTAWINNYNKGCP